jgi:hypothetical protein
MIQNTKGEYGRIAPYAVRRFSSGMRKIMLFSPFIPEIPAGYLLHERE